MLTRSFALLGFLAIGCSAPSEEAATSEDGLEVQTTDLWAGLASYTMERYAPDPCDDGKNHLDDQPISYDEWVRERAGIRNVCFEVWKPGVTDTDNPDYWKLLDVQVHYRYAGTADWKTAYVPSIDRRGHNRRYAWSLGQDLDATAGYSIAGLKGAITVEGETATSVSVYSDLEFYFTVNGHALNSSSNASFRVRYHGAVQKNAPEIVAGDQVLYPSVQCNGMTLGSGAGFFAADVKDPAAIAALLGGDEIYATRLATSNSGATLSFFYSSSVNVPAGQLPRYVEGYYSSAPAAEAKDAGDGKMTVSIRALDRTKNTAETLSWTFDGCHAVTQD
jgi:hypothetical protein